MSFYSLLFFSQNKKKESRMIQINQLGKGAIGVEWLDCLPLAFNNG